MLLLSKAAVIAAKPDGFAKIYSSMRAGTATSGLCNRGRKNNQRVIATHGDGVCLDIAACGIESITGVLQ